MHALYDNKYYPLTRKMHGTTRQAHDIARTMYARAYLLNIYIISSPEAQRPERPIEYSPGQRPGF